MRRRAMLASIALIAGAGLPGRAPQPALGAESTPVATPATPGAGPGAEPEVVIVDAAPNYLAVAVVPDAPAPPALMSLRRATLEPGASSTTVTEPRSVSLVVVESGSVTVRAEAPLAVTRGGPDGERVEVPAGDEVTVSAGDFLAASANRVTAELDSGAEPVSLLIYRVALVAAGTPVAAPTPPTSETVHEAMLAAAQTDAIPPAPVLLELLRFDFAPGGYVELPDTSPSTALVYVERGTMTVEMSAPATVYQATSGAAAPRQDDYPAGTTFTVAAGEFMIGQPYAAVTARNAGDEPLTIFMAVIQPAPAP